MLDIRINVHCAPVQTTCVLLQTSIFATAWQLAAAQSNVSKFLGE